MLMRLWMRASPLSIWAMIFSMSCSSLHRSQNTAEYSMTSSGVLPSTSRATFSMSSRPHFSLALMNWLKSRLFQMVKPCERRFSFSSSSSSDRGSASSIFLCSSF
uniref:Secreted protein n=1 Tax=Anguilla anguilla TaxID=7936 RepID=A0A0E9QXP7_ANGAN